MALKFHTKLTIMTYTCKIFNIIVNKLVYHNLHTQLYKTQIHIQPPQWLIINCPYRIICVTRKKFILHYMYICELTVSIEDTIN